jgi:hypothetical protein
MKAIFAAAILLLCAGCASKHVDIYYYPNIQATEEFGRIAEKQCRKFGLHAVADFSALNPGFGRSYQTYHCAAELGTPANPYPEPPTFYLPFVNR